MTEDAVVAEVPGEPGVGEVMSEPTDEHQCFEFEGARVHGDPNMPEEARDALRQVIAAATQQMNDQRRQEIHRLATILANTRPDDDGTEGEWAIGLWDAGVRPPKIRRQR